MPGGIGAQGPSLSPWAGGQDGTKWVWEGVGLGHADRSLCLLPGVPRRDAQTHQALRSAAARWGPSAPVLAAYLGGGLALPPVWTSLLSTLGRGQR